MLDYLLTNLSISLTALVAIYLLKNAPARLRFYLVTSAIAAWFIPWNLVTTLPVLSESVTPYTHEMFTRLQLLELDSLLSTGAVGHSETLSKSANNSYNDLLSLPSLSSVFFVLLTIGCLLFFRNIWAYYFQVKQWLYHSEKANHLWREYGFDCQDIDIRVTDHCALAMATGVSKPVVWLNRTEQHSDHLKTMLTHELNHIRQHDPLWMWLLTLAQSLFWWNPLVLLLSKVARNQIELSCDEKCQRQLKQQYSQDLAHIILQSGNIAKTSIPLVSIKNSNNFNIKRIKNLTKESKMKLKHALILITAVTMSSLAAAAISEQQTTKKQSQLVAKKSENKRFSIYNDNALHNELVDELLAITQQAKTNDPLVLNDIYENLLKWNANRRDTDKERSESSLKLLSFTMLSYVLDKLERHQEILTAFADIYPDTSMDQVLFLKHHLATAYIKMGDAITAIELMEDVIERQFGPKKAGSLMLLAHAHLANNDGKPVVAIAEQIEASSDRARVKMLALNFKRQAYLTMGDAEKAAEINSILKVNYDVEGRTPKLMGMASPLLSYLPEAS